MGFTIPEDLSIMRETVRSFVEKELEPISRQVEEEARIPEEIIERMRELGLLGLSIPEEYGGLGLSTLGEVLVYEEMTKTNAAFRSRIGTSNGIGTMGIVIDGTEEQKQNYLPKIACGQWTSAFALSEPEAGPTRPISEQRHTGMEIIGCSTAESTSSPTGISRR